MMENGVKLNYESLAVKQTSKKNVTNMYLLKIFHSLSGVVRPKKKKKTRIISFSDFTGSASALLHMHTHQHQSPYAQTYNH